MLDAIDTGHHSSGPCRARSGQDFNTKKAGSATKPTKKVKHCAAREMQFLALLSSPPCEPQPPCFLSPFSRTCLAPPDGRTAAATVKSTEESPGSTGIRCRLTAGGGDPSESATENKPPASARKVSRGQGENGAAKAHRHPWQNRGGRANSHREQDRNRGGRAARHRSLPAPPPGLVA